MKVDQELKEELKKYIQERIHEKKQNVTVLAPYKMSEEELNLLKKKLPFLHDAHVHQEVDESLLAGAIIKFGSKMIDLSLKGQLQSLQKRIYASL